MHISSFSKGQSKNGYHMITGTLEGDRTFKRRQLGIKTAARATAKYAIGDIIVLNKKDEDKIPQNYHKLKYVKKGG